MSIGATPNDASVAVVRVGAAGVLIALAWMAVEPGRVERGGLLAFSAAWCAQLLVLTLRPPRAEVQVAGQIAVGATLTAGLVYFSRGASSPLWVADAWLAGICGWYLPRRLAAYTLIAAVAGYLVAIVAYSGPWDPHWWSVPARDAARALVLAGSVVATALLAGTVRARVTASDRLLTAGLQQLTAMVAILELDGRIVYVNDTFCRLMKRPRAAIIGLNIRDLSDPDDIELTDQFYASDALGQPGGASYRKRLIAGDATTHWVEVSASWILNAQNRPYRIYAQAVDITESVLAKQRARRQRARERAIVEAGRVATFTRDLERLRRHTLAVARELLPADHVALVELVDGATELQIIASDGEPFPSDEHLISIAEAAIEAGEVIVFNTREDPLVAPGGARAWDDLRPGSVLCVLLREEQRAVGCLIAHAERPDAFAEEDVDYLRTLANILSGHTVTEVARTALKQSLLHDEVTGLPNLRALQRLVIEDRLEQSELALRAVAVLGIGRFSTISDALGHDAAEDLLRQFARRLRTVMSTGETVSRVGDHDFRVFFPALATSDMAIELIDHVLAALAQPFTTAEHTITLSVTAGIALATCSSEDGELIGSATAALGHAERNNPGAWTLFEPHMHERNIALVQAESALRHALVREEIGLVYQPQVSLDTGEIIGAEALARWQHPERGQIPPSDFIPLAEETGLIVALGRQVIVRCCHQLARWERSGIPAVPLAINISARQLQDDDLAGFLRQTLRETGADPASITLELTETAIVADAPTADRNLRRLKATGVTLALDDFGTGYASLSYLSRYPFDLIKLDRELIRYIADRDKDRTIAKLAIEMSHALRLPVVAEGVETANQHDLLKGFDCDIGQGYLYARPGTPEHLTNLLSSRSAPDPGTSLVAAQRQRSTPRHATA
ncbi:MAG TPA: EAL domain-containing protein [Solirubrobacteraceae bacterium]|nr:EAL domain-containing protein [Solirubrobacteraceae bacterium]